MTAARGRAVRSPAWTHLSRGMWIRAAIEARLLGRRLLTLDADITVLPAETGIGVGRSSPDTAVAALQPEISSLPTRSAALPKTHHGTLADAKRSLDTGADRLKRAREIAP